MRSGEILYDLPLRFRSPGNDPNANRAKLDDTVILFQLDHLNPYTDPKISAF